MLSELQKKSIVIEATAMRVLLHDAAMSFMGTIRFITLNDLLNLFINS